MKFLVINRHGTPNPPSPKVPEGICRQDPRAEGEEDPPGCLRVPLGWPRLRGGSHGHGRPRSQGPSEPHLRTQRDRDHPRRRGEDFWKGLPLTSTRPSGTKGGNIHQPLRCVRRAPSYQGTLFGLGGEWGSERRPATWWSQEAFVATGLNATLAPRGERRGGHVDIGCLLGVLPRSPHRDAPPLRPGASRAIHHPKRQERTFVTQEPSRQFRCIVMSPAGFGHPGAALAATRVRWHGSARPLSGAGNPAWRSPAGLRILLDQAPPCAHLGIRLPFLAAGAGPSPAPAT